MSSRDPYTIFPVARWGGSGPGVDQLRFIRGAIAISAAILAFSTTIETARAQDGPRLAVTLRTIENARGMRVVIGFSREPAYQIRQGRGRVVIVLEGESIQPPFKRKRYRGDVLEKIRCIDDRRSSEIIFYTGDDFGSYSSFEMEEPFRVVLDLRRRGPAGTARPVAPPEPLPPTGTIPGTGTTGERFDPGMFGQRKPRSAFVVVIDPGHGGSEEGARGPTGLLEKDVTLDIARRLKARLEEGMDVEVLLTRDGDRSVELDDRTAMANHNRADLFVSIHANASRRTRVRGAETYFLSSEASDDEARVVAAIENNAMGIDAGVQGNPNLEMVLWDLAQSAFLKESSALAEMIQDGLNDALGLNNRGIKQAPFRVLMGATMPAVLVEVGFISNASEEQRLRQPSFKETLATVIYDSIRRYNRKYARALIP